MVLAGTSFKLIISKVSKGKACPTEIEMIKIKHLPRSSLVSSSTKGFRPSLASTSHTRAAVYVKSQKRHSRSWTQMTYLSRPANSVPLKLIVPRSEVLSNSIIKLNSIKAYRIS